MTTHSLSTRALFDPRWGTQRAVSIDFLPGDVDDAVRAARVAARRWAAQPPAVRSGRMLSLVSRLEQERTSLAYLESSGTGKPAEQARAEVEAALDVLRFYAGASRTTVAPAAGEYVPGHYSSVTHEPLGVVGCILPWNYPLVMLAWRIGPALAAGNAVVVKPAEQTPDTALRVCYLAREILGPDVLTVITGGPETGSALAAHRGLDALAFTGSESAGAAVAWFAGTRPVSLELGGNGAAIVLPDAPIDTAQILVDAVTYNAGQSCAAPSRVIVVGQQDDFIERLCRTMRATDARDFGPLISAAAVSRIQGLIADSAYTLGARGRDVDGPGYYFPGTVLVDAVGPIVTEETFGPVLTVERVDDVDAAIDRANSVRQALGSSIHTTDLLTTLYAAPQIRGGEVWVNCHLVQSPELPHSGRGSSGQGLDLSADALRDYSRPKTITARMTRG